MKARGNSLSTTAEKGLLILLRLVVGVIFVWASIDKILHPEQFAHAVANYRILPQIMVNGFAVVLPWIELCCGVLLILGQWQQSASLVLVCLLAIFIVAVCGSLWRGLDIHCGCFHTASGRKVGIWLLFEDLLLFGCTFYLMIRSTDALGKKAFLGS
jgi:uncharacterized membrane protein YphA (DoxX/SURF4 family)